MNISVTGGNGILVRIGRRKISLDPHSPPNVDVTFVSHAHMDHVHNPSAKEFVVASKETAHLSKVRGYDLGNTCEEFDGIQLYDSGHILGSRGILIEDEVFYTGDFARRPRAFLDRGRAAKCRTLITEATYGRADFRFPPIAKILDEANRLIDEFFSRGVPVVLMGYPLGKAQIISYLFSSWAPIYIHPSVERMNEAHRRLGVDVGADFTPYLEAKEKGLLKRKPWLLISPAYSGRSKFVQKLKADYGAVTVGFTGWCASPGYKYAMNVDHAFPLSDHCDFDDLLKLVEECEPEKIYTLYGFASQFASHLRKLGYDARALLGVQRSMIDYME